MELDKFKLNDRKQVRYEKITLGGGDCSILK